MSLTAEVIFVLACSGLARRRSRTVVDRKDKPKSPDGVSPARAASSWRRPGQTAETLAASSDNVLRAAEEIRAGGLVAFPTETVYGLGAHAFDPRAVALIFEAKGRPRFDPLICHVFERAQVGQLAAEIPPQAEALAARFWPGPLTLVLPKRDAVPDLVTAGRPTVAVRVPQHPVAASLLSASGVPIAAPSANRFGAVSPTTAAHVREQLGHALALILDGGPCAIGVESTIVGFLPGEAPCLLRPGGVPRETLEEVIGPLRVAGPQVDPSSSPGRLSRHYAPSTPVALDGGPAPRPTPQRVGRLAFGPPSEAVAARYQAIEVLSPAKSLPEAAHRLFAALRRLDALGLDLIEAEPVPEQGLGAAIMDRLRRAEAARLRPEEDDVLLER